MRKQIYLCTVLAALLATVNLHAEVYFGQRIVLGKSLYHLANPANYLDYSGQGRFFASSDYGFIPGKEDRLAPAKLGVRRRLFIRGQDPASCARFSVGGLPCPWLSDGGPTIFGLTFDKPFKPINGASRKDKGAPCWDGDAPRFDTAVVQWGRIVPKPGTFGACLQDADGKYKRIKVSPDLKIYPYDQTTLTFPPSTVKALYFGVKKGFAEVRDISLLLHTPRRLDKNLAVIQPEAYFARYDNKSPGTVEGIMVANCYFSNGQPSLNMFSLFSSVDCPLTRLAPFLELNSKRFYAVNKSALVEAKKKGCADILRYVLKFDLGNSKTAEVKVKAHFGISLKDAVKFEFKGKNLPEGCKLGFEMLGQRKLFADYLDPDATEIKKASKVFATPAGPVGITLKGTNKLLLDEYKKQWPRTNWYRETDKRASDDTVRFEAIATGNELAVFLSLPFGPEAGFKPAMQTYDWYPSLAEQGKEGLAPFKASDLELLEDIDLSTHQVYDITSDPLILNWRRSGTSKPPATFKKLDLLHTPEKGKVPLTTVLGKKCRAINRNDTCYFRFNISTKFQPGVPYLIVVEHAFDQERRGEFHTIVLTKDGQRYTNHVVSKTPFGAFDTGKGPYGKRFKKESVFCFNASGPAPQKNSQYSLVFSNNFQWNSSLKELPEGLAVKSVKIYRVVHMPELPKLASLLPKGPRRLVTAHAENFSPWQLNQFPRLAGYDAIWANHQNSALLLVGKARSISRLTPQLSWHEGTLAGQDWLMTAADRAGMSVKVFSTALFRYGFEGTDFYSFECVGSLSGYGRNVPLSPTKEELEHLGGALDKALDVLAKHPSLVDISIKLGIENFFTKRNFDDFSRETGVKIASSPVERENINTLQDSPKSTIDAWSKWACLKRFEYLNWLLGKIRKHRSDLYLTLNRSWYMNRLQAPFFGSKSSYGIFDPAKLRAKGINNFLDFMRLTALDPALYAGKNGFCLVLEQERENNAMNQVQWPSPYKSKWFAAVKTGLSLCISAPIYEEMPKPLGYFCNYMRDRKSFRRDFLEALFYANAREFELQTYYFDPFRGRLDDMRELSVPFRLLPFTQPETYAGKLIDPTGQAVIKTYGGRHALLNMGDKVADVTLSLPGGAKKLFDLSQGVRQELLVTGGKVKLHLKPWSLKTLETK